MESKNLEGKQCDKTEKFVKAQNVMKIIAQLPTETKWLCEINGNFYIRIRIRLNNGGDSLFWYLNGDQKEGEIYLSQEKLEELFWKDESNWKLYEETIEQSSSLKCNPSDIEAEIENTNNQDFFVSVTEEERDKFIKVCPFCNKLMPQNNLPQDGINCCSNCGQKL